MPVQFFFTQQNISLRHRTHLKKFIASIFKKEKKHLKSLVYVFCSDKELLDINREFLSHDYYTDIITFTLSEQRGGIEGEVYISIDRIKENARSHEQTIQSELHRVMFHGALHLCGFKDKSGAEKKKMTSKEDQYLSLYFM
ncbi:MAG: rRNA maturation RNase YbeY [Ferruginibacter sp.]